MTVDLEVLYGQLLPLARVVAPRGIDGVDIVQEAFTRVLARHPHLRGVDDPRAYLSRTVVNVARSWGRRASRASRDSTTAPVAAPAETDPQVLALLETLAPRQRACLYLRFVEDLSVAQVAALLGCTTGTVKSQTSKALGTLRRVLQDEQLSREVADERTD
jgi:RNA polymerase sigma factor (sigma-70 family)